MFDLPRGRARHRAVIAALETCSADAAASCAETRDWRFAGAAHARRRCARRALRTPAAQLLAGCDRYRPVGHQAAPAAGRSRSTRRGRRAAAHRAHRGDTAIGAGGRSSRRFAALVAQWPALHDFVARFASAAGPQRRHAGRQRRQRLADRRLRAAADGARCARIELRAARAGARCRSTRFYTGYMKNLLAAGEFVQAVVRARCRRRRGRVRVYKISKRYDDDISAVCAAWRSTLDGGMVAEARLGLRRHGRHAVQRAAAPKPR